MERGETHFLADQLADPARVVRRAEAPLGSNRMRLSAMPSAGYHLTLVLRAPRTAWAVRLLAHGLQHAVHHKGDHLAGASFPEHTAHDAIDDDLGTLNGSLEGGRCLHVCNV